MTPVFSRARHWVILAGVVITCASLLAFKYVNASGDATFGLSPSSGSFGSGATINLAISETSSAGDNTNAVQVNLSFPASLQWQSSTLTGPFTLCAQNAHTATTVSLACASGTAQSGTQAIATISFVVVGTGSATVAMTSGSDIDNTSGSSVFSGTLPSANYTLPAPATPSPTPTSTATPKPSGAGIKTPTPSPMPSSTATPKASTTPAPASGTKPSPTISPSSAPGAAASNGSLSVTVTDSVGKRLAGAKAQLDGRNAVTANSSGVVNFAGVTPGDHTVIVTASGQQRYEATVTIASGENKLVTYKLTKALPISWPVIAIALLAVVAVIGALAWNRNLWRRSSGPRTNLDNIPVSPNPLPPAPAPAGRPTGSMAINPVAPPSTPSQLIMPAGSGSATPPTPAPQPQPQASQDISENHDQRLT
ncbi:MAG TPA: carboxypeptidase-like regulatory domain-containing protein [Candidatus Saccharimonadia bacterium]